MKIQFLDLGFEEHDRTRHRRRVRLNRKYRVRDRFKARGQATKFLPCPHTKRCRGEADYVFNRCHAAPELGYGVAYEHRGDVP